MAFLDIRQRYDYLEATFDILLDKNNSILENIKKIQKAYEEANEDKFDEYSERVRNFDRLISNLPDYMWVE